MGLFNKKATKPLSESAARAAFNAAVRDAVAKALEHRVPRLVIFNALNSHAGEAMAPVYEAQQRRQFA
jgi:hypothetical protein